MEYTLIALVVVIAITIVIARAVFSATRRGGPPNGEKERPPHFESESDDSPKVEIESEKLANRPR